MTLLLVDIVFEAAALQLELKLQLVLRRGEKRYHVGCRSYNEPLREGHMACKPDCVQVRCRLIDNDSDFDECLDPECIHANKESTGHSVFLGLRVWRS